MYKGITALFEGSMRYLFELLIMCMTRGTYQLVKYHEMRWRLIPAIGTKSSARASVVGQYYESRSVPFFNSLGYIIFAYL